MTDGALSIMDLVDSAPVFEATPAAAPPIAPNAVVRSFGLSELDKLLTAMRAATGDGRAALLTASAEAIGSLAAAGALHDGFAKAALENAAAEAGLVRDLTLRKVRAAIAAGLKAGAKEPHDLAGLRRPAPPKQRRARPGPVIKPTLPAAVDAAVPPESTLADAAPSAAAAPPAAVAVAAASPAPPAAGGKTEPSQTGGSLAKSAATGGRGRPIVPTEDAVTRGMRLAFFPLTDLGNAERFRERYRDKLLWCPAVGWLAWDGKRWSREGAEDLVKIAEHDTVRAIQREAAIVRDSGDKDHDDAPEGARDFLVDTKRDGTRVMYSDKVASWGRTSEAMNKLGALSKRGAPYFAIAIDKLDADKMKINVANGTLVVARKAEDGEDYITFKPHDPADLITKMSPVVYDPNATCPEYDKFLARVLPGIDMRVFIHQWFGLSMTGDVTEQKLAFLYGKGGNGKSVLVDAVSYCGGDYGETVPIETFLDHGKSRGAGQATPDLAILPGVRMLRTSEPEKNSKLAEAMVKLVTGGEPIQARHLNRDFFKFYPQFKLTMSGNFRPTISGADEGIWRRVRLVPFNITIPKEERDPLLTDKLRAEASGILNRLLDGLRHWCDKGLIEPEEVTLATAAYREDSDPLGRFLSACVEAEPGHREQSSVLFSLYEAWCKSSGEKAWLQKGFSNAMKERGYVTKQSNVMWWLDVRATRHESDFIDSQGHARTVSNGDDQQERTGDVGDTEF